MAGRTATARPGLGRSAGRVRLGDPNGYLFVAPLVLGMVAFVFVPLVQVVLMSFQNHNGVSGTWAGTGNYTSIFSDSAFHKALGNNVVFTVLGVGLTIPAGLVVALLIHSVRRFQLFYKAVFFLPYVVSIVATVGVFSVVFYPGGEGPANQALGAVGLGPSLWFSHTATAQLSIVLMNLWHGVGLTALIFLTGLQAIPRDVLEAARIDGAEQLQEWRFVTLPLLRPSAEFLLVIFSINGFKRFSEVYLVGGTEGSPGGALSTAVLYIYRQGFETFQFGRAAAGSIVVLVLILALTLVNFRLARAGRR